MISKSRNRFHIARPQPSAIRENNIAQPETHRFGFNKNNSVTVSAWCGASKSETLRHPLFVRCFSLAPIDAFLLSRPISSSYFLHHHCLRRAVFMSRLCTRLCIVVDVSLVFSQRRLNQVKCFLVNGSERKPRLYMALMQAALTR